MASLRPHERHRDGVPKECGEGGLEGVGAEPRRGASARPPTTGKLRRDWKQAAVAWQTDVGELAEAAGWVQEKRIVGSRFWDRADPFPVSADAGESLLRERPRKLGGDETESPRRGQAEELIELSRRLLVV